MGWHYALLEKIRALEWIMFVKWDQLEFLVYIVLSRPWDMQQFCLLAFVGYY